MSDVASKFPVEMPLPVMKSVKSVSDELARLPYPERGRAIRRLGHDLPAMFSATAGGVYLIGRDRHMRRIAGVGAEMLPQLCERALRAGIHDLGAPVLLPPDRQFGSIASAPILDGATVLGMVIVYRTIDAKPLDSIEHGAVMALGAVLSHYLVNRDEPRAPIAMAAPAPPPKLDQVDDRVDDPYGSFDRDEPTTEIPTSLANQIRRIQEDLSMAHKIQRRFVGELPKYVPLVTRDRQVKVLRIAAEYRPAFEIGGDFYDLIKTSDHRVVVVIGDVAGKGIAAALIMTRATTELRSLANAGHGPAEILAEMNRQLIADGHDESFVTAVCVEIDMSNQVIRVANASHVPPVIRRADGGLLIPNPRSGAPLGLLENESYSVAECQFSFGDIVVLMTDGISEALDLVPEIVPSSRLNKTIAAARHDAKSIVTQLIDEADRHNVKRRDDVALVAVQLG